MRISDLQLSNNFVTNINSTRSYINSLSIQLATGNKIQQASDDPTGTGQLLRWQNQYDQLNSYSTNINTGLSYLQSTTDTMQSIQDEVTNVLTTLTNIQNPTNNGNSANYADQINGILTQMINLANTKVDGKYIFGGTDFSSAPYALSADGSSVNVMVSSVSGIQNIMTSSGTSQQINIPGSDVFGTTVSLNGSIDSTIAVGNTVSQSTTVYDVKGNPFTLTTNFTKTATDTYNMTYDIVDGSGNSVFTSPPAAQSVVFDPSSGNMISINGKPASAINIKVDSSQINFMLDTTGTKETNGITSLNFSANQQTDIFNTLIAIRDVLKAGNTPTAAQYQAVSNYNARLLNLIAKSGDMQNELTNSQSLLNNRQNQLKSLMSNIQDVDVAKATVDLQTQNTLLQTAYQVASTTLKNSLVNYL